MAHIRFAKLVCDSCGAEIEIDPKVDDPFFSSTVVRDSNYSDWGVVRGKHLCGSCYGEYRHTREDHAAAIRKRFRI